MATVDEAGIPRLQSWEVQFGESHTSDTVILVSSNLLPARQYKTFVLSLLATGLSMMGIANVVALFTRSLRASPNS